MFQVWKLAPQLFEKMPPSQLNLNYKWSVFDGTMGEGLPDSRMLHSVRVRGRSMGTKGWWERVWRWGWGEGLELKVGKRGWEKKEGMCVSLHECNFTNLKGSSAGTWSWAISFVCVSLGSGREPGKWEEEEGSACSFLARFEINFVGLIPNWPKMHWFTLFYFLFFFLLAEFR